MISRTSKRSSAGRGLRKIESEGVRGSRLGAMDSSRFPPPLDHHDDRARHIDAGRGQPGESRRAVDDRDDDVQGWHDGFGELRVECEEENGLMAQQERSSGSHAPAAGGTMIGRGGRHQG